MSCPSSHAKDDDYSRIDYILPGSALKNRCATLLGDLFMVKRFANVWRRVNITQKAHAGLGQEPKWEMPVYVNCVYRLNRLAEDRVKCEAPSIRELSGWEPSSLF
jgi:hypothetical protein